MIYNFKTNFKKFFLYPILFWVISAFLLMIIFFGLIAPDLGKFLKAFFLNIFILGIFFGFSLLYLLYNHLNFCKYQRIEIERLFHGDFKIKISNKKNCHEILRTEIEKCIVFQSIPTYEKRSVLIFMGFQFEIFYYKLILKDGTIINISSSVCDHFEKYINTDKIEYKRVFMAVIKYTEH
ncbi:MAG: hypothetical protein R2790_03945 [Flavobacterium haoranii]